jgi:hypothetical protein
MEIGIIILIILPFLIWYYFMIIKPRKNLVDFSSQLSSIGYTLENKSNILAFKKVEDKKYVIKSGEHFVDALSQKKRFFLFEVKTNFPCNEFVLLKKPVISTPASRNIEKNFVDAYFNKKLIKNDSLNGFRVLYNKKSVFWKKISELVEVSLIDLIHLSNEGFSKIWTNYSPRKPPIKWITQAEKEFEKIDSFLKDKKETY